MVGRQHAPSRPVDRSVHRMRIGVVADDFTGASDIANTLARAGARTVLHLGRQARVDPDGDAAVVALKSRSIPAADAVAQSLEAARALGAAGAGADRLQVLLDLRFDAGGQHRPGRRGAARRSSAADGRAGLPGVSGQPAHGLPGASLRRRPAAQRERHGAPPAQPDDRPGPAALARPAMRGQGRPPAARDAARRRRRGGARGGGGARRAAGRRRRDRQRRPSRARAARRRPRPRHRRLGHRARPAGELRHRRARRRAVGPDTRRRSRPRRQLLDRHPRPDRRLRRRAPGAEARARRRPRPGGARPGAPARSCSRIAARRRSSTPRPTRTSSPATRPSTASRRPPATSRRS